ncbi:MAG: ATP-dependent helicase [Desulfohalobiaceae bacterium]|nr:ATP-dependent helicase [Desulfohalobiaceae bacterium]
MQLDLENELNPSQLEAVTTLQGPVLVIAGAGSGKTRTVVYRLAHLADLGVDPESILLLTFTRKAAREMLTRASHLLGQGLHGVTGGTFHSFANLTLRRYAAALGLKNEFTILDRPDSEEIVKQVKEANDIGRKDRSFPKKNTIYSLISKSRNKELSLEEILARDASHLLLYHEELQRIADLYREYKTAHSLVDYDDLLFLLERLLLENEEIREFLRYRQEYIMVDEFQDTNLVQGRLVRLLAGDEGNVMAVGDDAQSIYSFRGATVGNILGFTEVYPQCRIIKLEQNYRSTQPILGLCNQILAGAKEKYDKRLYSRDLDGPKPQLLSPLNDMTQARVALDKILALQREYDLQDIAVLFRAGFHSYHLEVQLNKAGISYQKFGGMKFTEAAHIKDVLAHLRLIQNPGDLPAWQRVMSLIPSVGPKTSERLYHAVVQGDKGYLEKKCAKIEDLRDKLDLLEGFRTKPDTPYNILETLLEHYHPQLKSKYPDDYPKRQNDLEQLAQIASSYSGLDLFLTDMSLEPPEQMGEADPLQDRLTLSTIHSAKGLEWSAVLVLDLVEERFPSKHALMDAEAMEEERRLFYVACTRAKHYLGLSAPHSLHNRYQGISSPATPSPFLQELDKECLEEMSEGITAGVSPKQAAAGENPGKGKKQSADAERDSGADGYCRHKIFGRGKIVQFIPPNKYKVSFPGFGLKVVIGDYLQFEE